MQKYLIILEKGENNYSAYSADILGCVATGSTKVEAERNMREAIQLHIDGLKEDNLPIPEPASTAEYIMVE